MLHSRNDLHNNNTGSKVITNLIQIHSILKFKGLALFVYSPYIRLVCPIVCTTYIFGYTNSNKL